MYYTLCAIITLILNYFIRFPKALKQLSLKAAKYLKYIFSKINELLFFITKVTQP